MISIKLPLWLRFVLLVGIVGLVSGASLLAYRYWTRPVTLSVAVGSIDGEAAKAMSAIASRLASNNASVRLNVVDSGTALGAAKAFSDGKVDLAPWLTATVGIDGIPQAFRDLANPEQHAKIMVTP